MPIVHLSDAARNAVVNTLAALIDADTDPGEIHFYSGTMPATVATAITSQIFLGKATFSATAFGSASSGSATANAFTAGAGEADPGTVATWARVFDGAGTAIMDVDVGTSGATINLTNTTILLGATITITSGSLSMPSGA